MNFIALWMWIVKSWLSPQQIFHLFSLNLLIPPMNWNREMEFFKNCLTAGSGRAVAAAAGRISQPHVSLPRDCLTSWSGALIMKMIIIMIISQCFINCGNNRQPPSTWQGHWLASTSHLVSPTGAMKSWRVEICVARPKKHLLVKKVWEEKCNGNASDLDALEGGGQVLSTRLRWFAKSWL